MSRLKLLLSLHDVTPKHGSLLTRAEALFRDLGVTRVTYLLVPRYHCAWPVEQDVQFRAWSQQSRPFAVSWCLHGYHHQETRRPRERSVRNWLQRRLMTAGEGEFLALGEAEVRKRIDRGSQAFKACLGFEPTGFVAPAWLFNSALLAALRERGFAWTEDRRRIYDLQGRATIDAPVITWATRTFVRRSASTRLAPALLQSSRRRPLIRIAVHPLDFDYPQVADAVKDTLAAALRDRVEGDYGSLVTGML